MTELPWLNGLSRLLIVADALFCVPVHDRVFDRNALNRRVPTVREKRRALVQIAPHLVARLAGRWRGKPSDAAVAEPCARRMRHDQQVPSVVQMIAHVAHNVLVRPVFGRKEIAGPRIMTASGKGAADDAREFASDEEPHTATLPGPARSIPFVEFA